MTSLPSLLSSQNIFVIWVTRFYNININIIHSKNQFCFFPLILKISQLTKPWGKSPFPIFYGVSHTLTTKDLFFLYNFPFNEVTIFYQSPSSYKSFYINPLYLIHRTHLKVHNFKCWDPHASDKGRRRAEVYL